MPDWVESLERLQSLRASGALTDAEFETEKAKLFNTDNDHAPAQRALETDTKPYYAFLKNVVLPIAIITVIIGGIFAMRNFDSEKPATQFTVSGARVRNSPTTDKSTVLSTLKAGTRVIGHWVEGVDPSTKWLKTDDGGYIWEGNLASENEISPQGMLGMVVGTPYAEIRSQLNSEGAYSTQTGDSTSSDCEIYTTKNGLVDVMVLDGKSASFETSRDTLATRQGIHVGSKEGELTRAYGELSKVENPNDGFDFFYWMSEDRGIKFHVSGGNVESITSGDKSINYLEGCE
jgi:hypothetical protein